jgi:hypothetical protein
LSANEQALPERYQTHPPSFSVKTFGTFNVSLVDEEEFARRVAASEPTKYDQAKTEAHRTNLLRRMVIFYEPDILLATLAKATESVGVDLDQSVGLTKRVQAVLDDAVPRRITVTTALVNSGQRAIALRDMALLTLVLPEANGTETPVYVGMKRVDTSEDALVVEGGKARGVSFESTETLDQLVRNDPTVLGGPKWGAGQAFSASRLSLLFEGNGLSAQISLAKAGAQKASMVAARSDRIGVGAEAEKRLFEKLRN